MDTMDFSFRHIGPTSEESQQMLAAIGVKTEEQLISETIPSDILLQENIELPDPMTERELIEHIAELGNKNKVYTSYIGMGWYDTCTPAVIQRNILENPVWYTSYTPYQAEISQGRLEALFNYQTVVSELTALPLTNSSLLDEAQAGAEAVAMLFNTRAKTKKEANKIFISNGVLESTQKVIQTRSQPQGIEVVVGDISSFNFADDFFGVVLQYPEQNGNIVCYQDFTAACQKAGIKVAVAADLLALTLLTPPGEWGADIAFGSSQRFGIPMYFGGPSAGYLAALDDYKRHIPGRIVGMSHDTHGKPAYRLALQTREQHIKREKATSNICTAQALLATMAGMYAVYHGPQGLKDIAHRIHTYAVSLSDALTQMGYSQTNTHFFDTLHIGNINELEWENIQTLAEECNVNFRHYPDKTIGISLDETTQQTDLGVLQYIFAEAKGLKEFSTITLPAEHNKFPKELQRTSDFLQHEVFQKYHTETELMRYIKRLDRKDISLAHSMISLGSCTMKLNAAAELFILSNPQFANIHPYAPYNQTEGYIEMLDNLSGYLEAITGLDKACLMPNSGAAGEYAGLRAIREYLNSQGQAHRDLVLLPASAHGTNPASAIQCGFKTITAKTDEHGNIDVEDFRRLAHENKERLAATMITYPSTHGIFEPQIRELCQIVHDCGGQVYIDGANMNAQVGFTHPGRIGADVCHLNLHKTFAIPHGGGGPGVGPICLKKHLAPYAPSHAYCYGDGQTPVSAAPYGSAVIFGISYAYIRMLGLSGLKKATATAILSANYMASRLKDSYGIVYTGKTGRVGHELILDCRRFKGECGIDETDIAKRLMDFGYHAPTLSFPVHGTLMVEPTESESKEELDRFIEVLQTIYNEIQEVKNGSADPTDNVLKNAPHPQYEVCADEWKHAYPRSKAAFPLPYLTENKFWINVSRIDNGAGDRNLIATMCAACQG